MTVNSSGLSVTFDSIIRDILKDQFLGPGPGGNVIIV